MLFPAWKIYLTIGVFIIAVVYALPNLFGSDLAIQVSRTSGEQISKSDIKKIMHLLNDKRIHYKSIEPVQKSLLIRTRTSTQQLKVQSLLKQELKRGFIVALNLTPSVPDWLAALGGKPMFLGLDLRGGVHFLLEVDMVAVTDSAYERYYRELRTALRKKRLYKTVTKENNTLYVTFKDNKAKADGLSIIVSDITDLKLKEEKGLLVSFVFSKQALALIKKHALKQNITTLRNRVNELGVSEPIIQQQGSTRIVVQLPGVQDSARAKEILGAVATLEFRLVDENNDAELAMRTGKAPFGSKLYYFRDGRGLLLKNQVITTGESIVNASSGFSQENNSPMVSLSLDSAGGRVMLATTQKHLHSRMAVVFIENKVETLRKSGKVIKKRSKTENIINAAVIQGVFSNRFQITGLDSPREARDLALLLRAGSLSAPVEIIEERTVGPSLGQDNIDQGFLSVIIGFFLVLVFMIWRYKISGLIADIALSMNLAMIIALLSLLQATLTLPGIAGIVLTVGMAVDANVLIFERIREELRAGSDTQNAIRSGYEKAFSTITDANITTLIAAIVLFSFGTGPIKGFAVTLSIGILTSMFSAILASRSMMSLFYSQQRKISI